MSELMTSFTDKKNGNLRLGLKVRFKILDYIDRRRRDPCVP